MTAELNEHGRELDAVCSCCDNPITSEEAAEHDGECFICFEDNEREVERWAVRAASWAPPTAAGTPWPSSASAERPPWERP